MATLNLIITADYEIFGNGSGSVDNCMIAPAEKMMGIAEKHGARICLFVDVCEYWAFKDVFEKGLSQDDNALKVENQLKDAIKRGHDVQLHFHPQWLDYKYQNGNWNLNQDYWRLPSVEKIEGWSIKKLFEEGKKTLEKMLQPINTNYKCDVFRAGAWCIQPEEEVLKAMKELGFRIESTVAPGKVYDDGRTIYDFSNTPDIPFWKIGESVTQKDDIGEILEYPIFTTKLPASKVFKFNRLKVSRNIPNKPLGCSAVADSHYKQSFTKKFAKAVSSQIRMLNNSDGVSYEEMKYITEKAIDKYKPMDGEIPLVMIGHPKTFGNHNEFDKYLEWVKGLEAVNFSSYKN